MHSHLVSYLGFYSTEEDQIHSGAILHVAYLIRSIPGLLMPWHHQGIISRHGIDQISWDIPSIRRTRLVNYTSYWIDFIYSYIYQIVCACIQSRKSVMLCSTEFFLRHFTFNILHLKHPSQYLLEQNQIQLRKISISITMMGVLLGYLCC